MMDIYILFKKYTDVEKLKLDIKFFEINGIKYQTGNVEINAEDFKILNNEGIIRILDDQTDDAEALYDFFMKIDSKYQHMYFYEMEKLNNIFTNKNNYSAEEVKYAKKIFLRRARKMSFSQISSIKSKSGAMNSVQNVNKNANWFLWIGILSILNIIAFILNQKINFLIGLNLDYFILGIFNGISKAMSSNLMIYGYIISIALSLFYILIWRKSKEFQKNYYLVGLIIYLIDTIFSIIIKQWYQFGFHVLALWILYRGFSLIKDMPSNKIENQN